MSRHNKAMKSFSKYKDNRLPCFQAYGYYKVVVNVPNNVNTLFTPYVSNKFYVSPLFHNDKYITTYKMFPTIFQL